MQTPGIGEYLAQQRKLRGISVDELCEITKIPRRNLERLEAGAFDAHPDGFARGFVRTVAAALGLDPGEAVMRLMQEPDPDTAPATHGAVMVAVWGAAVVGLAAVLVLAWHLLGTWRSSDADADAEAEVEAERPALTYRPDVVGDLARERGRLPPTASPVPSDAPAPDALAPLELIAPLDPLAPPEPLAPADPSPPSDPPASPDTAAPAERAPDAP